MQSTWQFRRRRSASIVVGVVAFITAATATAMSPGSALADPSPASVSFSSSGGGNVKLSITVGEASADYEDLSLTTSPHPNGYYAIRNISGPTDKNTGQQVCQAVRSSLNCATAQAVDSTQRQSFSVTFAIAPQYPNDSVNSLVIGYPDNFSESITFCGPDTSNIILERKLYENSTLKSDQKSGGSCPQIGVAGVRFAPRSQTQPSTPGLPVIWDRPNSMTTEHDQAGSLSCAGIGLDPTQYDYLDCATNPVPQGNPVLNWPVVIPAGQPLTLDETALYSPTFVPNAKLAATATVGGATLKLSQAGVAQSPSGSGYKLVASGPLTFSGTLPPSAVGRQMMTIEWKLTSDAGIVTATSSHAVYITADRYAAPTRHTAGAAVSKDTGPYLSIVDFGTTAAAGVSGQSAVTKAIWQRFASRQIPQMTLDPATGAVTPSGKTFTYYGDVFHSPVDYFKTGSCPELIAFLESPDDGHCGDWAWFLEQVLAYQGVPSSDVMVGDEPGFDPGPPPLGQNPRTHNYMLIAPWVFGRPNVPATVNFGVSNQFIFGDPITSNGAQLGTRGGAFAFNPNGQEIAQGKVSFPVGMFHVGDHRLVYVPATGTYFDPSYGNPSGGDGYSSVHDWENASVDGFAALYAGQRVNRGKDLVVSVLGYYSSGDLIGRCQARTCVFAATEPAAYYRPSISPPNLLGTDLGFDAACPVGPACTISADLIGRVDTSGGQITGVASAASIRKVVLGHVKVKLRPGSSRRVKVALNGTGRALLRQFHRLPVTLTVTSGRRVLARTHPIFTRRH